MLKNIIVLSAIRKRVATEDKSLIKNGPIANIFLLVTLVTVNQVSYL